VWLTNDAKMLKIREGYAVWSIECYFEGVPRLDSSTRGGFSSMVKPTTNFKWERTFVQPT